MEASLEQKGNQSCKGTDLGNGKSTYRQGEVFDST